MGPMGAALPDNISDIAVFQCVIGVLSAILGAATGNVVIVDGGGGDGFFDEVSTRRRDDYQFITGTGKYAKEG